MNKKMTPQDFARKVDWEGGLYEAVTSYGLSHDDLDPDADPELYAAVKKLVEYWRAGYSIGNHVESLLDEYAEQ